MRNEEARPDHEGPLYVLALAQGVCLYTDGNGKHLEGF